ncbi:MAG TPA: hypothetical protein VF077_01000 [Nitrospiraceae bacterium]
MITRDMAINARHGTLFYHISLKMSDGTPSRARVNGKCQTWKRRPEDFRLPMKYGLKECFSIDLANCGDWCVSPEATVIEAGTDEDYAHKRNMLWNHACDHVINDMLVQP